MLVRELVTLDGESHNRHDTQPYSYSNLTGSYIITQPSAPPRHAIGLASLLPPRLPSSLQRRRPPRPQHHIEFVLLAALDTSHSADKNVGGDVKNPALNVVPPSSQAGSLQLDSFYWMASKNHRWALLAFSFFGGQQIS